LSVNAAREFIEAKDLIKVDENLQKLYSAAWLIYQRSANEPYLQTDKEVVQTVYNIAKQDTAFSLFTLNSTINAEEQEIIKSLVSIIKHKVPSVQAVIYLGNSPVKPDHIFLLVFTNSEETRQAHSLSNTIEESCAKITTVTALVHDSSILFRANYDNLFFSKALRCPVVFLSGDLLLPVLSPGNGITGDKGIVRWDRWFGQGKEFLNGAEYYMTIGADNAALFSLHQCTECLLVAIIRAVTGYGINVHNLKKLLDLTLMFTTDIANIFELEKADKLLLFNQLKHAYIDIRYKDTFEVDPGYTAKLYQCIRQLLVVTEKVYQKHLLMSSL
jgi:HEPN domain-containing protein